MDRSGTRMVQYSMKVTPKWETMAPISSERGKMAENWSNIAEKCTKMGPECLKMGKDGSKLS